MGNAIPVPIKFRRNHQMNVPNRMFDAIADKPAGAAHAKAPFMLLARIKGHKTDERIPLPSFLKPRWLCCVRIAAHRDHMLFASYCLR